MHIIQLSSSSRGGFDPELIARTHYGEEVIGYQLQYRKPVLEYTRISCLYISANLEKCMNSVISELS